MIYSGRSFAIVGSPLPSRLICGVPNFGTILSNIPEIGLAYSGLEKIIFENDPETLSNLAMLLGLDFINADVVKNLDLVSLSNAEKYAAELGYTSGILYKFYSVSIGSGIAPL